MNNYLDDHFIILEQVGEGANAIVYRAKQKSTQQIVAIKKLKIDRFLESEKSKKMIARFKRETELCAQLNHPNIVSVIDTGVDKDNYPFAVYEYVSGETLKSYIQKKGRLTSNETKVLMEQVLDALSAAHAKGIVHRDLKPQNIMVFTSGSKVYIKILDFGIGAMTHQFKPFDQTQLTMTEDVLGTPIYAAPEQLRGGVPTTQSDLYAWGLITLECLTGTTVLSGNTLAEVFHQHLALSNIPLPSALVDHEIGTFLRTILQKSLDKRASDTQEVLTRFQSLNFSTLVGVIGNSNGNLDDTTTEINYLNSVLPKISKRNITVLAIKIRVKKGGNNIDLEILETIQKDQFNSVKDLAIQYGGYIAASYANHIIVYFGYPEADDSFVRRAGKTALFIRDEIERRNENLKINYGITFTSKMAIHTGEFLIKPNEVPEGFVPEIAIEQLNVTPPNQVLCSEISEQLLNRNYNLKKLHSQNTEELQGDYFELISEKEADTLSSTLSNLVGRVSEKKEIFDDWTKFKKDKTTSLCLLHGEAGMGKSSLIANFCNTLKKQRENYLMLQVVPEGQNSALKPFLSHLLQCIKLDKPDGTAVIDTLTTLATSINKEDVEQRVAVLCAWLGLNYQAQITNLQLSPQKQKQIVFQFLTDFLKNRFQGENYALIVEDVHWLDPTSIEFIQTLATIPDIPFFLFLSSREKEVLSIENITFITVEAMDVVDTELLCKFLLGNKNVDTDVLNYIHQKANGIPLYVEELVLTLQQENFLSLDNQTNTYQLNNLAKLAAIPAKLSDLLHARLDQLVVAKPLAQAASVLGRFFKPDLLKVITQIDKTELDNALLDLLEAKIIVTDLQEAGGYVFRHALIRDAAYNSILNQERKAIHLNVAEVLEENQSKGESFEIAEHYGWAESFEKAVDIGKNAAKYALGRSMNQETLVMCAKVKQWISESELLKTDLNLSLSIEAIKINALMAVYGWAAPQIKSAALKAFEELKTVDYTELDKTTIIEIYWALIMYYHVASERENMKVLVDQLKISTNEIKGEDMMISSSLLEGLYYYIDGNNNEATTLFDQAYELIEEKDGAERYLTIDIDNEVHLLAISSLMYSQKDQKDKGREYGEKSIKVAKEINHVSSLGLALFYHSAYYYFERNQNKTQELAQELLALSDQHGLVAYGAYGAILLNWALGNKEPIDQIITQLEMMGCKLGLTLYKSMVADLDFQAGNYTEALDRIEQCLELCEINKEFYYQKNLLEVKKEIEEKINITI